MGDSTYISDENSTIIIEINLANRISHPLKKVDSFIKGIKANLERHTTFLYINTKLHKHKNKMQF